MTTDLPLATAAWLVGPEGLAAVAEAHRLLGEGYDHLTVGERSRELAPAEHRAAVVATAVARDRASAAGYPGAERLLLTRTALEQASRPEVARWRAGRFADLGGAVVDLCCGIGMDTAELARRTDVLRAVDLDPARVLLARHNLRDLPVGEVLEGDALDPARTPAEGLVHADPSRRVGGRRARRLADYGPPVALLLDATRAAAGRGIAVSPALALDDPDLPPDGELEFVQVGGDLVEATLWTGSLARGRATATLLPSGATRTRTGDRPPDAPTGPIGAVLVEVAPAAVRARLHDDIAREIGAHRVDRGRALLTVADDPGPGEWWRRWYVEAVLSARPKVVRRWLAAADDLPLALSSHGMAVDPAAWWRSLGDVTRGPFGRRLHLVRTTDGGRCIVTRDPAPT